MTLDTPNQVKVHKEIRCSAQATEPTLTLPGERTQAMLPEHLLQGDETILLLVKPSPWFIILSILPTLVGLAAVSLAAAFVERSLDWTPLSGRDIAALGSALMGMRVLWQALEWASRLYILTDQRVIRIKGVLRVELFQTPLKNIQHTELSFPLIQRLLGLGTMGIFTSGTNYAEAYWQMLKSPLAVQREIIRAINRYTR